VASDAVDVLFQPLDVGGVRLRNRFVMSPMTRHFSPGGVPGQDVAAYYRRRAEHEVGLIVTEGVGIDHPAAIDATDIPLLHGDAALAGWQNVVDEVHEAGGVIFPQLWHQGVMRERGGPVPDAPSCRPSGLWGPSGRRHSVKDDYVARMLAPTGPMSEQEIADVIAAYACSAANAKAVGFDGIAIHAAHGYLIDTFFWDETNLRVDRYGGDRVGRTRFGGEVVEAIRTAVGPGMPIAFRFSQWKQQDYDARIAKTPQELEQILAPLVDAGVDMFDASTRRFEQPAFDGSSLTLAGWTRKLSGKPTMCVGGVGLDRDLFASRADGAETINNVIDVAARIRNGEFDLVGVGRSLLADPSWIEKVRTGAPFRRYNDVAKQMLY
jgi:2,4-dienoyl-CoA reductase-like NADH-dependent reductase (Old Yellow Enzyme family)